jgi:transcriptional regulator with XRE-family HTH domain
MSEFGQHLKAMRKRKKMSQRELAQYVGVDFTYISKIENDAMPAPSEETIRKIASALGEDADKMIILAKKIPSDLQNVIYNYEEVPVFLRKAPSLTKEQWDRINDIVAEKEEKYDGKK